MPGAIEKFIFFPSDNELTSREGITTLRDGRQVTDPDVLIRTPEFEEHLEDIRETVEDFMASAGSTKDSG